MNRILGIAMIVISGVAFGGCVAVKPSNNSDVVQKDGFVVTKTGKLTTKAGDEYLLTTEEGIVNLNSNKVNLKKYMGKTIEVKGMFSGSTLYVDEVAGINLD